MSSFYFPSSFPAFPDRFFFVCLFVSLFLLEFKVFKTVFHLTVQAEVRTTLNILNKDVLVLDF